MAFSSLVRRHCLTSLPMSGGDKFHALQQKKVVRLRVLYGTLCSAHAHCKASPRFNGVCACFCVVNVVNRGKGKWYSWWNLGQDKNLPPSSKSIPSTPPNSSLSWLSLLQNVIYDFCISAKKNSKSFPRFPPSPSLSWLSLLLDAIVEFFIYNFLFCEELYTWKSFSTYLRYFIHLWLLIFVSVKLHSTSFE